MPLTRLFSATSLARHPYLPIWASAQAPGQQRSRQGAGRDRGLLLPICAQLYSQQCHQCLGKGFNLLLCLSFSNSRLCFSFCRQTEQEAPQRSALWVHHSHLFSCTSKALLKSFCAVRDCPILSAPCKELNIIGKYKHMG